MATELAHDLSPPAAFERTGCDGTEGAIPAHGPGASGQPDEQAFAVLEPQIKVLANGSAAVDDGLDGPAVRLVPTEHLHSNRLQPRSDFDEAALQALADSIEVNGMLQPIIVRPHPNRQDRYEVVAGERRWRAARVARIPRVPVVVREVSDREALALALIENVHRQDLTPLETAEGYRRLMEEFGHSQDDLARVVGKSRSQVSNTLRLLGLPAAVKQMLRDGHLSAGHARALAGAERPEELARRIVAKGLSVRQAERLARRRASARAGGRSATAAGGSLTAELERELSAVLGLRVNVSAGPRGGTFTIHFTSLGQVEDLVRRLKGAGAETRPNGAEPKSAPARPWPPAGAARNEVAYGPAPVPVSQEELAAKFGIAVP
ncbi:MAG: ParB/RepB/Spo0J family partition protein [Kiloniellaceae bacterium]